ncbi:MAG: hotdog fold thioesterase [Bacteroidota bacterium]|jgi:acyl-CoA thioesterase
MTAAEQIVSEMMARDSMSQWMGIQVITISPGNCKLEMVVREPMLNGFRIAHGGVAYALADTALAFASNAHGIKCYSVETSISHVKTVELNDTLTTKVEEKSLSKRIGIYWIEVLNQRNEVVALFKGVVHRSDKNWLV